MRKMVLLVFLATALFSCTKETSKEDTLKDGLIAYYPFNGNANDESGNAHNGIINGAVLASDRNGVTSSAFSFDGINDYISLPPSDFKIDEFSYSFWIKVANFPSINEGGWGLISVGAADNGINQISSIHSNGGIAGGSYNLGNNPVLSLTKTNPISKNQWIHIAFIRDLISLKIYINGVLTENAESGNYNPLTNTQSADYGTVAFRAVIGGRSNLDTNAYFEGLIDDVRIYNRVLTAEEIQKLHQLNN